MKHAFDVVIQPIELSFGAKGAWVNAYFMLVYYAKFLVHVGARDFRSTIGKNFIG